MDQAVSAVGLAGATIMGGGFIYTGGKAFQVAKLRSEQKHQQAHDVESRDIAGWGIGTMFIGGGITIISIVAGMLLHVNTNGCKSIIHQP